MVTNPKIIFIIVCGLLIYGFIALLSTVYLIIAKADAALIAVVASSGAAAIGNVSGMLNNTRTSAAPPVEPSKTEITNTPANPVPTSDQPAAASPPEPALSQS